MTRLPVVQVVLGAAMLVLTAAPSQAQTGGTYDLTWSTIDGGGATFSSGAGYRLGGTVGQPDAGTSSGGVLVVKGGFWGAANLVAASTPTPTVTGTVQSTPTPTATLAPTDTATPPPTPPGATATPDVAATATGTPEGTPTASQSPSATATPTPSPTATPPTCPGDCNQDGSVTVDELIRGVNIALGTTSIDACPSFDTSGDGMVTVDELIAAVNRALNGCVTPNS